MNKTYFNQITKKEETIIRVKTKQEWENILTIFLENGYVWRDGLKEKKENYFNWNLEHLFFNNKEREITYGYGVSIHIYIKNKYKNIKIIDAEEFLKNCCSYFLFPPIIYSVQISYE